ncbi:hypothetical protein FWC31_01775 [Candidatus Saccharibacteria bacterium]|nr:hypothetical protein [Candidatus Saccharibacteria bacterium]
MISEKPGFAPGLPWSETHKSWIKDINERGVGYLEEFFRDESWLGVQMCRLGWAGLAYDARAELHRRKLVKLAQRQNAKNEL